MIVHTSFERANIRTMTAIISSISRWTPIFSCSWIWIILFLINRLSPTIVQLFNITNRPLIQRERTYLRHQEFLSHVQSQMIVKLVWSQYIKVCGRERAFFAANIWHLTRLFTPIRIIFIIIIFGVWIANIGVFWNLSNTFPLI